MDFLNLLKSKDFVAEWEVLTHRIWKDGFYYKIRVRFSDSSNFQATEYNSETERNYSFHWQSAEGKLIIRWDNAPHHKHLENFPYHKHTLDQIESCEETTFESALEEIEKVLKSY